MKLRLFDVLALVVITSYNIHYTKLYDSNGIPYTLKCVSLDGPGIIHTVTRFIRTAGINIENLETETAHARNNFV